MQTTTSKWDSLWQDPNTKIEYKIVFDGAQTFSDEICPPVVLTRKLMSDDEFTLGTVASHTLTFSLHTDAPPEVRAMAKVELYIRLALGEETSEWLKKGVFTVENRKTTLGRTDFECVDAVLSLDTVWLSGVSPRYNPPMRDALRDICALSGIDIANIEVIPEGYRIGNANDLTRRQAVSFIASACGCNAALDEDGRLRLYPLAAPVDTLDVGMAISSASAINETITIRKVTLQYSEGEYDQYSAGSGDSRGELFIYNEWATEAMAADLLAQLGGYSYNPVSVNAAHIDPAYGLMDGLTADGLSTQILNSILRLDGHALTTLAVPNDGSLGGESRRYSGVYDSDTNRRINRLRTELLSVIVACEHISSDGGVVTIRPVDEYIADIKSEGTYQFTVAYAIPSVALLQIVDHDGRRLAQRRCRYTNGKDIRSVDFAIGARVEVLDSGESFFVDASGSDTEALFQDAIVRKYPRKIGIPGCGVGVRGSI